MADDQRSLEIEKIKLRPTCVDDVAVYFEWVSDEVVRQQSFHSEPILWEDHQRWFKEKLLQQSCFMFVMEADQLPVGQIRFDIENNIAYIDYSLEKAVRGKHWGAVLVSQGIELLSNNRNLIFQAEVKQENIASAKIFLKLGFKEKSHNNLETRLFQLSLTT